ncbi:MAG: hypothetical protein P8R42_22090 [Candidatus Binatia bacterium]|nr:hypothetical protein [Candidatus Binatia bacterium]
MDNYVGPGALFELIGGALRLNPNTYRAVSRSRDATKLCVAVAVLAGAASAPVIGPDEGLVLPVALVIGILLSLGILAIESALVWGLCRLVLREPRSYGEVVRPLAAAHVPRVGYLLVPIIGYPPALGIGITVWMLATFVVAMEAATRRGWLVAVSFCIVVGALRWLVV